jgi:hypothetical protein
MGHMDRAPLDWVRMEGRREAAGATSDALASASVKARFSQLSPRDVSTVAFLVLMAAAHDLDTEIRIPNPPVMVMDALLARRERLRAILADMAPRTPSIASRQLRDLR